MTTNTTLTPQRSPITEAMRRITMLFGRATRPLAGRRWFTLWAVLVHRGRKSGLEYRTPIVARPTLDGFIIPLPFGAGTQWTKNLLAAGAGRLRWNGTEFEIRDPEIVDSADAARSFSRVQQAGIRAFGMKEFVRVRRFNDDE
jgi:deazaflavin-dependent oxidoreductase (nitroreductase family)